jgi:hypothetical protein
MLFQTRQQPKKGLTMKKDDFLLSSDYDENDNHYYYIYNWKTLDILKKFDNLQDAENYFNSLPD